MSNDHTPEHTPNNQGGWDKEAIFDAEIAPLMAQIIHICNREEIPAIASFLVSEGEEDEYGYGEECFSTTHLPGPKGEFCGLFVECVEIIEDTPDADRPLPEDAKIDAAHPVNAGRHEIFQEAMRLVGARRSKAGLVALVNWILTERDELKAEVEQAHAELQRQGISTGSGRDELRGGIERLGGILRSEAKRLKDEMRDMLAEEYETQRRLRAENAELVAGIKLLSRADEIRKNPPFWLSDILAKHAPATE